MLTIASLLPPVDDIESAISSWIFFPNIGNKKSAATAAFNREVNAPTVPDV